MGCDFLFNLLRIKNKLLFFARLDSPVHFCCIRAVCTIQSHYINVRTIVAMKPKTYSSHLCMNSSHQGSVALVCVRKLLSLSIFHSKVKGQGWMHRSRPTSGSRRALVICSKWLRCLSVQKAWGLIHQLLSGFCTHYMTTAAHAAEIGK